MKVLFVILCLSIITWIFYPTIKRYVFVFRAVNAEECLDLSDATDCLQRKIVEATGPRKWWQLPIVYLPAGDYYIKKLIDLSPVRGGEGVQEKMKERKVDKPKEV